MMTPEERAKKHYQAYLDARPAVSVEIALRIAIREAVEDAAREIAEANGENPIHDAGLDEAWRLIRRMLEAK